jgi:membrane protein YqaA with SNARE-associated domain
MLALLTWVPFVGDVFAVVLGFYRTHFWKTAFWMFVGKSARFIVWALLALGSLNFVNLPCE